MRTIKRAYDKLLRRELAPAMMIKVSEGFGTVCSQIEKYKDDLILHRQIAQFYSSQKVNKNRVNKPLLHDHVNMWKRLQPSIDTKWIQVYIHYCNIESPNYIPEDIYFQIVEPCLNYQPLLKGFSDKNLYDRSEIKDYAPKALLRKIHGTFYDRSYNPVIGEDHLQEATADYQEVIAKPTINTSGGKGVELFKRCDGVLMNSHGDALTVHYLNRVFGENYIVQEKIIEHETLNKYNPSSVNTIRLYTYRSVVDETVIPLDALMRVGRPDTVVDNLMYGGLAVGLDQNGVLGNFAIDKRGNQYDCLGDFDLKMHHKVEYFRDMVEVAKKVARTQFYSRVLGFDLTVDTNLNVRILEINNRNMGIFPHQMFNGPLFKDYTEEVIEFCIKHRQASAKNADAV